MNINLGIIDQQVRALAQRLAGRFADELGVKNDEARQHATAFVLLVTKTVLDLSDEEAFECLTDGGNDFGVDALEIGALHDGEFGVTLVQGKYKRDLEGRSAFPETGVTKVIQAVGSLFDPDKDLHLNPALQTGVEEIRSRIRDGAIPHVRVILCNNGLRWTDAAQKLIDQSGLGAQVVWEHVSHDALVAILQATKPVDDALRLVGKALVEEFDFRRVLVGRTPVSELALLFERHGDRLLDRNIRRYLGLQGNRVNQGIEATLRAPEEQPNFYFYNNGITLVCTQFQHNALQGENWSVRVAGLQVINGGQTCKTIQHVLSQPGASAPRAHVLIRIYELPKGEEDLVRNITYATNSQNPVDLRDLRSNDERQRRLDLSIGELGYQYRRQRSDSSPKATEITSATAAEAVLSVWRERPQQAKFMAGEHFGKLYDVIFTPDLNGGQVVVAVLLFRLAENLRKRPPEGSPDFVRYGSCFLAMLMGRHLLADLGLSLAQLDHRTFAAARGRIEAAGNEYLSRALAELEQALRGLYGDRAVSLQQLSATFRRGDLLEFLGSRQCLLPLFR